MLIKTQKEGAGDYMIFIGKPVKKYHVHKSKKGMWKISAFNYNPNTEFKTKAAAIAFLKKRHK